MKNIKSPYWLTSAGIILIVVAIILLGWFFLRGETVVTGKWNENNTTEALRCEAKNIDYTFLSYDNANSKDVKIDVTFINDRIESLALVYKMYYGENSKANDSSNINHAAMNINFGKDGLGADAFDARYSVQNNIFQMNLYTTKEKINSISAKYFFLDVLMSEYTRDEIEELLENKSFHCVRVE